MVNTLKVIRFKGADAIPYIPDLARLRIKIFHAYPYLYVGDMENEEHYLKTYVQCPESIVVIAFDEEKVIGASTAIPLEFETGEVQQPFVDHHILLQRVFYFGESVLEPSYRGRNIYRHFFTERESAARAYGCSIAAFAAVERALDDPRRPADYFPLDEIWHHFGYQKHPELRTHFTWLEVGESAPSIKPLTFWLKNL